MKKNTFILTLCMWCVALAVHAQHIPTLEEAVYGGLVRTEGGGSVNWMKDGEHYSKIERNAAKRLFAHRSRKGNLHRLWYC